MIWTAEGGNRQPVIALEDLRGQVVAPVEAGVLQELLPKLQTAPSVEAVSLVAFTVESWP